MKTKKIKSLLISSALVATMTSFTSHAGIISTDWHSEGDSLSSLHQETGIEWLDLTVTKGKSLKYVLEQTETGGIYDGWRLPTLDEISNLFSYAFNKEFTKYDSESITTSQFNSFSSLFGLTQSYYNNNRSWNKQINGWTYEDGVLYQTIVNNGYSSKYAQVSTGAGGSSIETVSSYRGVWLVNDGGVTLSSINNPSLNINNENAPINGGYASVPVSGTLAILSLSLIGFGSRRKS